MTGCGNLVLVFFWLKPFWLKSRLKLSLSVKECLCRTGSGA